LTSPTDGISAGGGASAQPAKMSRSAWIALTILLIVYILNFMDRWVITILLQPIKEELKLADWELGLLNGFAFSVLSSAAAIKLARMAETQNRVRILTACIVFWSALTVLCGFVTSFWQLILARMGVGVGEAGGMPSSHSLLADYFPPERRALAHAIYGLGLPVGGMLGMMLGGLLVDLWGWRSAFIVVGAPGLLVALIVWLFLKEPPRGRYDPPAAKEEAPPLAQVAANLWRRKTTRHILIGLTLAVMLGNTGTSFLAPYLIRRFALTYSQVALLVGATNFLTAAIGMLAGGFLTDRLGQRNIRWYMWIPMLGILISIPFNVGAYLQDEVLPLALFLALGSLVIPTYMAPSFATLHNLSQPRSRATVTALAGICMGMIGAGLGPLLGGISIDLAGEHLFGQAGFSGFATACPGGLPGPGASAEIAGLCAPILARATQLSLLLWAPTMLWPAWHFWLASRSIKGEAPA
jgi:MFS family permease